MQQDIAKKLDLHLSHVTEMLQRSHEQATQAKEHAHEVGMAAMQHQQALEQGQQAADVASQQMQQQAAMQSTEND
jgi:hypothetical protein